MNKPAAGIHPFVAFYYKFCQHNRNEGMQLNNASESCHSTDDIQIPTGDGVKHWDMFGHV